MYLFSYNNLYKIITITVGKDGGGGAEGNGVDGVERAALDWQKKLDMLGSKTDPWVTGKEHCLSNAVC